jgi:hypothetical protein
LIFYYTKYPQKSKARLVYQYLFEKLQNKQRKILPEEKTAILSWILKLFFAPLMIVWFMDHIHKL